MYGRARTASWLVSETLDDTSCPVIAPSCTLRAPQPPEVRGGHSFGHTNEKGDPEAAFDLSVTYFANRNLTGATRRDRTGDLVITKFRVMAYAIDSAFGPRHVLWAHSAW